MLKMSCLTVIGMSDPSFKAEEEAPPPPPRPTQPRTQLEADELYARQLNEHYNAARHQQRPEQGQAPPFPRRQQQHPYDEDDGETSPSFFDGMFNPQIGQHPLY